VIRSDDGTRIVKPNSIVFTQAVTNHSPDWLRDLFTQASISVRRW